MIEYIQVSTTVDTKRNANKIAEKLLRLRLASCVQVLGPIESSYWWKSKLEDAREWLCIIKARENDYHRIESAIKKIHPYETPEIIALPVVFGSHEYLEWIRHETILKEKRR